MIIILLTTMSIFSFFNNKNKIIEKTFSEIQGFTFNYPVFKYWEVSNIKKITEDEYRIFFKCPYETYIPPSMNVRKIYNIKGYMIPGLEYSKNPNKVKYYPSDNSNTSQKDKIIFFNIDQNFIIEIKPYIHEGEGYSSSKIIEKIIDSFKFQVSPESKGYNPLTNIPAFQEKYQKAIKAVIIKLKENKDNPKDFYAKISEVEKSGTGGSIITFHLSHKNDFKPENYNKIGNPSGKSRDIIYDTNKEQVIKELFWR